MKNFSEEYKRVIKKNKDSIFLTYVKRNEIFNLSYVQFDELVKIVEINLYKKKIKPKDNLSIVCQHNFQTIILIFACLLRGINLTLINQNETNKKILELSEITNTDKIIFFKKKNLKKNYKKFFYYEEFFKRRLIKKKRFFKVKNFSKIFLQTSGTTGESKIIQTNIKKLFKSSINFNKFYKLNIKKYKFWNFYPLNYMGGFYNLTLIPFFSGNSVVISRDNENEFYFNFLRLLT